MSELKDYSILDIEAIDDERFKKEKKTGKWVPESRVYLKSDVDKEIARQKYKRCLAMALLALEKRETYRAEYEEWCLKWYKRWLELAEQFKEA